MSMNLNSVMSALPQTGISWISFNPHGPASASLDSKKTTFLFVHHQRQHHQTDGLGAPARTDIVGVTTSGRIAPHAMRAVPRGFGFLRSRGSTKQRTQTGFVEYIASLKVIHGIGVWSLYHSDFTFSPVQGLKNGRSHRTLRPS